MQTEDIRIKTLVEKQESNKKCAFCPCNFIVDDENRWDIYICYLHDSDTDPSAFMVCNDCRPTREELNTYKATFMQYADRDDEWYKVDDYVPLNY